MARLILAAKVMLPLASHAQGRNRICSPHEALFAAWKLDNLNYSVWADEIKGKARGIKESSAAN